VPQVTVTPPPSAPTVRHAPPTTARPAASAPAARARAASSGQTGARQPNSAGPPSGQGAQQTEASVFAGQTAAFNAGRNNIFAPLGTAPSTVTQENIQALPQGDNAPLTDVLLQLPGVTKDSAATGSFHVRNEHAYVQYRINGIMLPDGLSGFGPVLDTSLIGNLALITGALPAQYGLRSSAIIDITTRSGAFDNSGSVAVYGGSRETRRSSFEYGGRTGNTEYFITGSYLQNILGIENPTPSLNAIHDFTQQWRGFGYMSTILNPTTRFSVIAGTSSNKFQIPNTPGQIPPYTAFGVTNFNSSLLNENQIEPTQFAVATLQKDVGDLDAQVSYFTRYAKVHFTPDPLGDLMFNGVATDVFRGSMVHGVQADVAYRVDEAHTLRSGLYVSAEKSLVSTAYQLLPLDGSVDPPTQIYPAVPFGVVDPSPLLGWLTGVYLSDEWKMTDKLTFNAGLRFDQMNQYINANQVSPRASITYKPVDGTTFHVGYANNFTPPVQVIAAPTNTTLVSACPPSISNPDCTTVQAPAVPGPYGPVLPERSHVFDVGVVQNLLPGLTIGTDIYYKYSKDLLDDGQFGAAYVLDGFNYDRGQNIGAELRIVYTNGGFRAYTNWAWARQIATNIVSNQYLFDADELAYISNHYIYTDHAQVLTGSAGMSYLWMGTRFSTDMIYGSGLRSGFANTDHLPPYAQVNVGLSREVKPPGWQPMTLRFDVVNVFDTIYAIRDGSGIGVFAPQYGPRRAFFVGLSQKFGYRTDKSNAASNSFAGVFEAAARAKPQDLFYGKSSAAAPWTWAGFYLGAHAGSDRGLSKTNAQFLDETGATHSGGDATNPTKSPVLGVQAGYNWQLGTWLAGIEGDVAISAQRPKPTFACPDTTCNPFGPVVATFDEGLKLEGFATLRARMGAALTPDILLYATGGLAIADVRPVGYLTSFDDSGNSITNRFDTLNAKLGWAAGLGLEAHLMGPWTSKFEYLHMELGTVATSAINDVSVPVATVNFASRMTNDMLRVGVNYKFN
jgi:outer membrane receptor protein involved in Fe transport/opacity protein-like surface antigen